MKENDKRASKNLTIQLDLKGQEIDRFKSIREAEKLTGISRGNISGAIKGRLKTAGGFKWKLELNK